MKFGVKQGEEPAYDPEAAGTAGSFIKYFKDGKTTLIFLEEINQWTSVWMHFNQTKNRDYPCTDDKPTCPGHNSENEREARASRRYIVNALNVETGYVDLWKIPYSIIDDLLRQSDKFGTIKDRPYTIYREDKPKTTYSIDREEPMEIDRSEYTPLMKDHQEALAEAFREVWGGLPDEPEYTGGDLYSGDEPVSNGGYLKPLDKERVRVDYPQEGYVDPPSEPAAEEDEGQRGAHGRTAPSHGRERGHRGLQDREGPRSGLQGQGRAGQQARRRPVLRARGSPRVKPGLLCPRRSEPGCPHHGTAHQDRAQ